MQFLIYPYRKRGHQGWIALDLDADIAYRFHSHRRINIWCKLFAARHGQTATFVYGEINQVDVVVVEGRP